MIDGASILVTGGFGAIGSALCRALLRRDVARLTVIDDHSSSLPALTEDIRSDQRVSSVRGSIIDDEALVRAFAERPAVVFHLAAHFANQNSVEHPVRDCEVNSLGTVRVLEHASRAEVKKFIFASSSCVYGSSENFSTDTRDFHLDTPYAIDKLHGEYLVKFYHKYHGMNTTILRYFNSFGPGEMPGLYRNVTPNFLSLAMRGLPLPITGDPKASRDFNYIDNVVTGTLLATEESVISGKIYNIGSGKETSIGELAEQINRVAGSHAGVVLKERRAWDTVKHRCADISETQKDLGYEPIEDLPSQLQRTYEWLRANQAHFPSDT